MQKSVDSFRNGKYNKHIKFPQRKDLEENNMDVKKIKEEFIEYFGEEKWNQEKVLADVRQVVFDVCERWLSIKPVPVLFNKDIVIKDKKNNKETINISKKIEELIIKIRNSLK